jgi:hypothetical protein
MWSRRRQQRRQRMKLWVSAAGPRMKARPLAVAALLAGCVIFTPMPALAQKNHGWGGYEYRGYRRPCSPLCIGASASWVVNDVKYSGSHPLSESYLQWIGIADVNGPSGCPGSCLGQFGTGADISHDGHKQFYAWYELYCGTGSPCFNLVKIDGFPVNPGDSISAVMKCAAGCTKNNPVQRWSLKLVNSTRRYTWTHNVNWPLSLELVHYVIEPVSQTGTADFGISHFSDARVNEGGGFAPARLSIGGNVFGHSGSGANERFVIASPPFGPTSSNFNVCYTRKLLFSDTACDPSHYSAGAVRHR